MHNNSLETYKEGMKGGFQSRSQLIFNALWFGTHEYTDRELLQRLKPGSDNINYVQPRITEMTKEGVLEECGDRTENGRKVRVSRVKQPERQQVTLF